MHWYLPPGCCSYRQTSAPSQLVLSKLHGQMFGRWSFAAQSSSSGRLSVTEASLRGGTWDVAGRSTGQGHQVEGLV